MPDNIVRTGFEPVLPPWKGGVLTPWPTDHKIFKWARVDSNHRPHAYQACALTTWATRPSYKNLVWTFRSKRVTRIELATTAWKAVVLPLNYTRLFNNMARDGIEPPTHGASIHCSTNWATEPYCGSRIWTYDLRVMSPTSYLAAPSRDSIIQPKGGCGIRTHARFYTPTAFPTQPLKPLE